MFALIETKGASHIAINIPHESADKTIPALAGMLESNAVFICMGYNTLETRVPEVSIQLLGTPEVLVSNKRRIEEKDKEIKRLRLVLQHQKQQLSDL